MYAAKRGGKSSYVVFEPRPEQETAGDLQLGPDLGNALDRDELRAVYQPIVNLETQAITGVEALVRWEHPVQGLISPAQFLPLAEHYGIIFDLDMWMLKQACDELAIWRGPDLQRPFDINVNLSGDSLQHPDLLPRVVEILLASGADPRDLVIELTEGVLIRDVEMAVTKLRELKALGIRIAVDDFGTGYSSLAYLRRFPLDILKIDKSFVDGIAAGPEEASFAGTIVALADQLHLSTVAEGVECMEQAEVLLRLGVRQAQGYFFSRPTTARAVQELIESPSHLADSPTLVAVTG
jgi:EAL domain-containing protein (putative c-di-GMP-specific phosphodiesterase class I)